MALKLNKVQQWRGSKRYLSETYDITVHYSNVHHNYFSAWQYVTKSDTDYEESEGHPDLRNGYRPRTNNASVSKRNIGCKRKATNKDSNKSKKQSKSGKKKRLALQVSDVILKKKIQNVTELHALAQEQRDNGKTDLVEFILNRTSKALADLLDTTLKMKCAKEKLARTQKTCMEILTEAFKSICPAGCNGLWLKCAREVLAKNGIDINEFANLVKESLTKGRGKHRNLMIVGPTNCGKTFILKPLTQVYATFCNPASETFASVGIENAECIFLNNFRWSAQLIPWHDLLLLVHLPARRRIILKTSSLLKTLRIFAQVSDL